MTNANCKEKGQVLYLLAIGMITLLAFAGLAIDGGRVYSEKRLIQGVADTSAMTGALYIAQNIQSVNSTILEQAKAIAENRADSNGYDTSVTTVTITEDAAYYYIETLIQTTVEPTIGKIVYKDDFGVAARSIARVKKVFVFALGQALYSINPSACKALYFQGNSDTMISGTGIFSNSNCLDKSISFEGNTSVDIEKIVTASGGIYVHDIDVIDTGGFIANANQMSFDKIDEPDCTGLPNRTDGGSTLQPGIYSDGIHLSGNGSWTFEPGLYCLDDDLSINNGDLTGDGVTFFMRGTSEIHINGGDIHLTAPHYDEWTDGAETYWNGMLIFYSYDNNRDLLINGNAGSYFEGTIYNYGGDCQLNGSGASVGIDIQLVCDTIDLIGTADLVINYNPDNHYIPPITIDLVE